MAGAGYKLFATGDVLTAAQVNTYLMQQTVMVFASSAARTTALSGVLAEGMVSYLQDTNTLEVYDGSAWVGATGDITGLTAGTGISITSATGPVPTVAIDTATTVDKTTAQTLTNKTLTSPVLTTPSISNIEAKGDILVGTADNTLGVLTAGANGETIVADSSTSTGLRWQGDYAAGKNKIINGDFGIWQRGTSITIPNASNTYCADRFAVGAGHTSGSTVVSQQTFTPGTAPVAGYEGQYFLRITAAAGGSPSPYLDLSQRIEDVRTFAGQTVTLSFWAKASVSTSINPLIRQNFGSGGSANLDAPQTAQTATTSWARYSFTLTVQSVSGKTIGTSSFLQVYLFNGNYANNQTIDIWGVQIEAGSVATAFQTATGTLQGELAACQRYYYRQSANSTNIYQRFSVYTPAANTTTVYAIVPTPVTLRTTPTSVDYTTSGLTVSDISGNFIAVSSLAVDSSSGQNTCSISVNVASGLTQYRSYAIIANNSATPYLGLSAEL